MDQFKFGTCTVPDGKRGAWRISTVVRTKEEARGDFFTMAYYPEMFVPAGTYRRLTRENTVVMSNTPMEISTNREAFKTAAGRVLINGLGLGMLLEGLLSKPNVTYVRVVEVDRDVIALVGPHFTDDARVEIVHADATTYRPALGERFDYVWHDIWDDASVDNFPAMNKLTRSYARFSKAQGVWSRDLVRRDLRRNGMTVKEALA